MIWIFAILALSFLSASFFWLRGIWRNRRLDCFIGLLLLVFCCLNAQALDVTTSLLNDVGFCIMALGVATIVIGRHFGRCSPSAQTDSYGLLLMVVGFLLTTLL